MWSCSWGLIAALLLGLIAAANIGVLGILVVGKRADLEEQTRRVRDAHHRESQQVPEKVE